MRDRRKKRDGRRDLVGLEAIWTVCAFVCQCVWVGVCMASGSCVCVCVLGLRHMNIIASNIQISGPQCALRISEIHSVTLSLA